MDVIITVNNDKECAANVWYMLDSKVLNAI